MTRKENLLLNLKIFEDAIKIKNKDSRKIKIILIFEKYNTLLK